MHASIARRGVLLALACLIAVGPAGAAAQGVSPGGHRKWVYALIGGVVVGVPAFLSSDFAPEIGSCEATECFAPLAAAVGATVGFVLGLEKDNDAARIFVAGPRADMGGTVIDVPIVPTKLLPFRRTALVVGTRGLARVQPDGSVQPLRGVRGLTAATLVPDNNLVLASTAGGLFAFPLRGAQEGVRIWENGGPVLLGTGDERIMLGGAGRLQILEVSGNDVQASVRELARISIPGVPSWASWEEEDGPIWTLNETRVVAYSPDGLQRLGRLNLPAPALSLDVEGSLGIAAAGPDGVFILDLTDPERPVVAGHYQGVNDARGAAVAGSAGYVAAGAQGLVRLDLSVPSDPVVTGVIRNLGAPAMVVRSEGGLYILDEITRELRYAPLVDGSNR